MLRGKPARGATQQEWEETWNSLAFYSYVQSVRLTRPLTRPTREEWTYAKEPIRTVLARLKPQLVLFTGMQLFGHAAHDALTRDGRPGVWFPISDSDFAYARGIYHPSARRSTTLRDKCREIVTELLDLSKLPQ